MRTYSELIALPTFKERFDYLYLGGSVGADTFGFDRYLNQVLYRSDEWRRTRNEIIIRDNGCDLAIPDREIGGLILIHHINPITKEDILDRTDALFNPEFLICVSRKTHNAIHYGYKDYAEDPFVERSPNDQCPWRK